MIPRRRSNLFAVDVDQLIRNQLNFMEISMYARLRAFFSTDKLVRGLVNKALVIFAFLAGAVGYSHADVERYPLPNGSTFPISQAVEISNVDGLVFLSGATPLPADRTAEPGDQAYYGDTRTQTVSVMNRIKENLEDKGLEIGDIIKLTVFLVGDPALDGVMDFAGFMEGYTQFFGTEEQPNLPARSAFQIARLGQPLMFIEIEAIAVRD